MAAREAGPPFPRPPGAPARSSFSGALNSLLPNPEWREGQESWPGREIIWDLEEAWALPRNVVWPLN